MLTVEALQAWYGRTQALFDVSFDVSEGETLGLIGANGAGKSTVIRSIIGTIRTRGRISLDGAECGRTPAHQRVRKHGIAVLHEGRGLFQQLSVKDNLLVGLRSGQHQSLDPVLKLFPELSERLEVVASNLSGGEQQMVALGRCVLRQPRLLLLDEPSLGLAPIVVDRIYQALAAMRTEGMATIVVEQDIPRVAGFADRLCHIHMGVATAMVDSGDASGVARVARIILGQEAKSTT
jgi:branched-chain amino acid transport system ATP-binding protein